MNICQHREKKFVKLIICDFFLIPSATTSGKISGSKTILKLDLGMAKQCTKYQMNICKEREKKSLEN
jgi:hypothetical protein